MRHEGIGLRFLKNEAGEDEGLGHAGIETYKDAPYSSVGRECGQNSTDAMIASPVVMRFDLSYVPVAEYPMHAAQVLAVEHCLKKAKKKADDKEIEFFARAKEVLAQAEVAILTISDENTKGLVGPPVPGTPFHSLVKSTGVSSKDSETSGGSFGIGKNAAFAVSELQTVFYATEYHDQSSGQIAFLAQGKNILISHPDENNLQWRATGYWGMPGFEPVSDKTKVPAWLRRDGVGTSVIVAGFRESEHWQYRIAAALLQNFFCALFRGEIRFLLDNGLIDINRDTVEALFEDEKVMQAAKDVDDFEDFEFAKSLYVCLRSADSNKQTLQIPGLGPVTLITLIREGLPKRVRIVRNGMAITDELGHFGDKFASFPLYKEFVALVEPASPEGGKLIKRLENPRHNSLSAERLADPVKRREATEAMRRLAKAVRAAIKEQALPAPEKRTVLDEMSEFFDAPNPNELERVPTEEENPEILTYKPDERRKRHATDPNHGTQGKSGGRGKGSGKGGKGAGAGAGTGRGSGGGGSRGGERAVPVADLRNTLIASGDGYMRRLFFTPGETGAIVVRVFAPGVESPEPLTVAAATTGTVVGGGLGLTVTAGARQTVDIAFTETYSGPIELVATTAEGSAK